MTGNFPTWDTMRALEARCGELEAANERLRARLAAVEARTADLVAYLDWCNGCIPANPPKESNVRAFAMKVRAAARGEGDRPAEPPHEWVPCPRHMIQTDCGACCERPYYDPIHSGEGDRG